jgi:hypothetical protein
VVRSGYVVCKPDVIDAGVEELKTSLNSLYTYEDCFAEKPTCPWKARSGDNSGH